MYLVLVGINYKTAPVELREKLSVDDGHLEQALARLKAHSHGGEFCIISTCNRTELYCVTRTRVDDAMLTSFLAAQGGVDAESLKSCTYIKHGHYAISHLFRVACGLDSMSLGETQVLGQVRNAFCVAGDCHATGAILNSLFQKAIEVGKRARTETAISSGAFSLGAAAVQLAKLVFTDLSGRKALLLGAGDMGKLAAAHLQSHGVGKVYIASRTRSRVDQLAEDLGGEAIDFDDFARVLPEVDFIITSTSSPAPVITRRHLAPVMADRCRAPLFIIDIAVPRDVAADVAEIDGVFLYNVDDLKFLVDRSRAEREGEVAKVEEIVAEETSRFMGHLRTLEAVPLIRQLREKFESVYDAEWERYSAKLAHLPEDDREYVRKMLRSTVRKLTHDPILRIKSYALNDGNDERLDVARELFGLSASEHDGGQPNPRHGSPDID